MKTLISSFAVLLLVGCGAAEPSEHLEEQAAPETQLEQAVSNVPNTCFGASGSNCSGFPDGFCSNSTTTPGWVSCRVSIGSQMHDSCCMRYPGGETCGSTTAQYCSPPAGSKYVGSTYRCCKAEWDHAVGDMAAGRYWSWGFNESVVAPPGYSMVTTIVSGGEVTARYNSNSIRPKSGAVIWKVDAAQGWCPNGIRSSGLTDAICN
ncbi:MAG TPA: hypothetical protein VEZ71_07135 [Archangium sp.]|nr:hypothetical protein [Archangium sp.]